MVIYEEQDNYFKYSMRRFITLKNLSWLFFILGIFLFWGQGAKADNANMDGVTITIIVIFGPLLESIPIK